MSFSRFFMRSVLLYFFFVKRPVALMKSDTNKILDVQVLLRIGPYCFPYVLWEIPSLMLDTPGCWEWEEIGALFAGVFWGVLILTQHGKQ